MAFWFGYLIFAAFLGTVTLGFIIVLAWHTITRVIKAKLDVWMLHQEIHAYLSRKEH